MRQSLLSSITRYAETCDDVVALVLVGSGARSAMPADAFSDIDLLLIVRDAAPFLCSDSWLEAIGSVHISFTEPTVDGQMERRVLFDDAQDVDFVILDAAAAEQALLRGEAAGILSRGYRVLVDKRPFDLPQALAVPAFTPASEAEFLNVVQDFWFHTVWAAKKLLRGELWAAKFCADGYMKQRLLWMIEQHEHSVRRSGADTWYGGRFIDRWAGEDILRDLRTAFAHYTPADVAAALRETMKLFRRLAAEVAQARGFAYPEHADTYASAWVDERLASPVPPEGGNAQ